MTTTDKPTTDTKRKRRTFTIDHLCKLFKLPTLEGLDESFGECDVTWSCAYDHAIKEGKTETEAENYACTEEQEQRDEYIRHATNNLENAIERGLEPFDLKLTKVRYEYLISPKTSWKASAELIRQVINGVGMFHFGSLSEFYYTSSVKSYKELVVDHLHWCHYYGEVYGGGSVAYSFERSMR